MNMRISLAACGLIAALAAAVTGCGSNGSGGAGTGTALPDASGSAAAAGAAGSPGAPTGAAAPAGAGTTALPSWAAALGSGTTLDSPETSPAANTPEGVVQAYVHAMAGSDVSNACSYVQPSTQQTCISGMTQATAQGDTLSFSYNTFSLGYTAINGAEALVGSTYTQFCMQTEAQTCAADVTDPKAVFETGKSFADLWASTLSSSSSSLASFTPIPCVEVNGKWYVDAT
jgi:hypothetical protein